MVASVSVANDCIVTISEAGKSLHLDSEKLSIIWWYKLRLAKMKTWAWPSAGCNPSTQDAEAGGSQVPGQPG
jgi:hypothetical protein